VFNTTKSEINDYSLLTVEVAQNTNVHNIEGLLELSNKVLSYLSAQLVGQCQGYPSTRNILMQVFNEL
jgi:hypothetical protein